MRTKDDPKGGKKLFPLRIKQDFLKLGLSLEVEQKDKVTENEFKAYTKLRIHGLGELSDRRCLEREWGKT